MGQGTVVYVSETSIELGTFTPGCQSSYGLGTEPIDHKDVVPGSENIWGSETSYRPSDQLIG
jgi:hypothetical protein